MFGLMSSCTGRIWVVDHLHTVRYQLRTSYSLHVGRFITLDEDDDDTGEDGGLTDLRPAMRFFL